MTLKLGIQHRVLKYYQMYSNDDTLLALAIFMTWLLFPNASALVKAYTTYSHVFPSLFSISYAIRLAIQDPLAFSVRSNFISPNEQQKQQFYEWR